MTAKETETNASVWLKISAYRNAYVNVETVLSVQTCALALSFYHQRVKTLSPEIVLLPFLSRHITTLELAACFIGSQSELQFTCLPAHILISSSQS